MAAERFDPQRSLSTLVEHGVRFVLIGGLAGAVRGSPLLTGDVDVCYERGPANLERMAAALGELGATLRGAPPAVPFILDARTLRAGGDFTFTTHAGPLDILATPAGTDGFADLDARATDEDIDGLVIRVASIADLIRMKRAAGRPQDLVAVEWLTALRDEIAERRP